MYSPKFEVNPPERLVNNEFLTHNFGGLVTTYKKAGEGTNKDNTEATQVRIREEGTKDGQDVGHGRPSVENIRGLSNGHVIIIPQVQYHVRHYPIACHLLQTLIH